MIRLVLNLNEVVIRNYSSQRWTIAEPSRATDGRHGIAMATDWPLAMPWISLNCTGNSVAVPIAPICLCKKPIWTSFASFLSFNFFQNVHLMFWRSQFEDQYFSLKVQSKKNQFSSKINFKIFLRTRSLQIWQSCWIFLVQIAEIVRSISEKIHETIVLSRKLFCVGKCSSQHLECNFDDFVVILA